MKKIIVGICVYILKKLNASVFLNCDIAEKDGEVYIGINDGGYVQNIHVNESKNIFVTGVGTNIGFVHVFGRFKIVDKIKT